MMGKYRQVICPYCKHQYMTHIIDDNYDVKICHDGEVIQGWVDRCPMCNRFLYAIDNVLLGVAKDEDPENEIEESFILR